MVEEFLDSTIISIAEELSEQMGLSLPTPDLVKVAGAMVATEAVRNGLDLLIPSASSVMSFSTTGLTLAFIQRKLREISKQIDLLLDMSRKAAKDKMAEALTSLEHGNFPDAHDAFKVALDKATDGFHTSQDNESRVACTKIKLFCILMIKSFDKKTNHFFPFAHLSSKKKTEVGALMQSAVDALLDQMKANKDSVDFMDVVMFKTGVKKKMLQVRLNELFASAYRFMSEGLEWTEPSAQLNEDADVTQFRIYPQYLPAGDEDDALSLVIGTGRKTKQPLSISVYRQVRDKKKPKMVAQNTKFQTNEDYDNILMVEIFAGKLVPFHDQTTLVIDAARVGRPEIIISILQDANVDINAKNFKGESALISAAKSGYNDCLYAIVKHAKEVDFSITDDKGNTCLHHAAKLGNLEAFTFLASNFKTLDVLNVQGESPLTLAAAHGQYQLVQHLIIKKVALNHKTDEGCTALFLACQNGHTDIIKLLMKAKADHLISRETDKASPLWIAAANGHLEVVKLLCKSLSKQRLRDPNRDGLTPAKVASEREHITVYMYLQKQGGV